jgi:hypothetical protein
MRGIKDLSGGNRYKKSVEILCPPSITRTVLFGKRVAVWPARATNIGPTSRNPDAVLLALPVVPPQLMLNLSQVVVVAEAAVEPPLPPAGGGDVVGAE